MKIKYLILLLLVAHKSFSCSCAVNTINQRFMIADFVAKVKVKKSLKEWRFENESNAYNVEFEIEELYKGEKLSSVYVRSFSDASCGLVITENSEWIIFAYQNSNNLFSTDLCSGSKRIDLLFNESLYPNANKNYNLLIDKTLEVLRVFKKFNVSISDKTLITIYQNNFNELYNKYDACDYLGKYALYKVILNSDLSVKKVEVINGFSKKFDKGLKKIVKQKAKFMKQIKEKDGTIMQNREWLLLISGTKYDNQPCYFNQQNYL